MPSYRRSVKINSPDVYATWLQNGLDTMRLGAHQTVKIQNCYLSTGLPSNYILFVLLLIIIIIKYYLILIIIICYHYSLLLIILLLRNPDNGFQS